MSNGVTDEQRVAAFRDRYGRVLYEAQQRHLDEINPGRTPGHPWEEIALGGREYLGIAAEAVINAFLTGNTAPPADSARIAGELRAVAEEIGYAIERNRDNAAFPLSWLIRWRSKITALAARLDPTAAKATREEQS